MTEKKDPTLQKKKDSFDKAIEMLDEYYEGTPARSSKFDEGGE